MKTIYTKRKRKCRLAETHKPILWRRYNALSRKVIAFLPFFHSLTWSELICDFIAENVAVIMRAACSEVISDDEPLATYKYEADDVFIWIDKELTILTGRSPPSYLFAVKVWYWCRNRQHFGSYTILYLHLHLAWDPHQVQTQFCWVLGRL